MPGPVPPAAGVDYPHLPDEPHNPLMESSLHAKWCTLLIAVVRHTLAGTGAFVTGNTPFVPADGGPHTAPDLMVVPGLGDREFGRYEIGRDGPAPTVCIEVISPSNTRADIDRRTRRWLEAGVAEVYVLDPWRDTIERVELADGTLTRRDALGDHSPGLALSFATDDGHLALCCPGGRLVTVESDSFAWLLAEQRRADDAEARAEALAARVADLERQIGPPGRPPGPTAR